MEQEYKLKVLWIDDQPSEPFMDDAYDNGIDIIVKTCVSEGLKFLKNNDVVLDAIILDANCKIFDDPKEAPNINALSYAIVQLYSIRVNIPWFVYTGGSYAGKEALEYIIPEFRPWDNRKYYKKPDEEMALFDSIKEAVKNNESTRIKIKYLDTCSLYQEKDLVDLLVSFENDSNFDCNITVPTTIRSILEWILHLCNERGVLPTLFTGTNIAECSKTIGDKKMVKYIPVYIQRCFHFLSDYSNAGSHRYKSNNDGKTNEIVGESIKRDIGCGKANYLNRMGVVALLNILKWCNTLSENPEDIKKIQIAIDYTFSKK